jgi:hypothetical protein
MTESAIGTVISLARYPVKSMAGERLETARVTLQGVDGDRRYAFVQAVGGRSMFPWLTGREFPGMVTYRPRYTSDADGRPALVVEVPAGEAYAVVATELLRHMEAASGLQLHLLADYRGSYDVAQVSMVSKASIDAVAAAAGVDPDPERFRMNVVVDTGTDEPFTENAWVGCVVEAGGARVAITERDKRCVMTNIDPGTAVLNAAVLRELARANDACLGVYGSVLTAGEITVGMPLVLIR